MNKDFGDVPYNMIHIDLFTGLRQVSTYEIIHSGVHTGIKLTK